MAYPGNQQQAPPAYTPTPQAPMQGQQQPVMMQQQPMAGHQPVQYQQQPVQYQQQPMQMAGQPQPMQMATHPQSHVVVMQHPHVQQQPAGTHVTVVNTAPKMNVFGQGPSQFTCSYCGVTGVTRTVEEPKGVAWFWAACLCLVCWPLAWIPFVSSSCKDYKHFCTSCNQMVARVEGA